MLLRWAPAELRGILPALRWMNEIRGAIAAADKVVVVITPAFVASSVCRVESDHAVGLHKRIIPVVGPPRPTPPPSRPSWC
jgi:hypothetical protein